MEIAELIMQPFICYLIAVNILAFWMFFHDKEKAIRRQWRIPEIALLGISAMGGAIGGYLAMQIFRHKTKKPIFRLTMPLFAILQIAVILYFQGDLK